MLHLDNFEHGACMAKVSTLIRYAAAVHRKAGVRVHLPTCIGIRHGSAHCLEPTSHPTYSTFCISECLLTVTGHISSCFVCCVTPGVAIFVGRVAGYQMIGCGVSNTSLRLLFGPCMRHSYQYLSTCVLSVFVKNQHCHIKQTTLRHLIAYLCTCQAVSQAI